MYLFAAKFIYVCLAFQNLKRINHARLLDGCHGSYMSRQLIQSVVCCILLAMLLMKEIKLSGYFPTDPIAIFILYYYNKATDPFERRGAMALYRMMCWAPISISIGSSLYSKKEIKKWDLKRSNHTHYVWPLVLHHSSDHLTIIWHIFIINTRTDRKNNFR